jgi:hypothetical protein
VRSGFGSREAAREALAGELSALADGMWADDRSLTVAAWLQEWLTPQAARGSSPKTLANYRGHVRDVWTPSLGQVRLRDLRRAHVEQVLVELLQPVADDLAPTPSGGPDQDGRRGNVGRRVERRTVSTVEGIAGRCALRWQWRSGEG